METGGTLRQLLAALSATLAFFIGGTYLGWSSPALPQLQNGEAEPHLTRDEASWVASLFAIGQIFTPFLAGYLVSTIGRKLTLLASAAPFLLGWILTVTASSAGVLYAARTIAGLGIGIVFTAGPMYLGEIAEDRIRGALGTLFQVMMSMGVLFESCVGPYVSTTLLGILSAIFPILFVVTFIWMPESPYYYLLRNRREDAQKSLVWLRCAAHPGNVQDELSRMENFVNEDRVNRGGLRELVSDRGARRALIIAVSLILFQNLSGIIPILSYSTQIFEQTKTLDASVSVMVTGGVQLALGVVSSSIVDIAGRRLLMIVSSVGCAVALAAQGLFFYLQSLPDVDTSSLSWLPITAIIIYLIFYIIGLGPIPVAIQGELFPTSVKAIGTSISSMVLGAAATTVTKLYQVLGDAWGVSVVFWIFSGGCVISTLFCIFVMPETKGKSFMEINKELSASNKKPSSSKNNIEALPT